MTSVKTDAASLSETRERVLAWFAEAGRDLPWRATRDPYRVLVAEVLAQQTQAARAAEAWPRFLERFPDVGALAAAAPAEVLRAWQGLGYNRRALALRRTAQAVVERGGWPATVEELASLPGVGPYTARAVACFALEPAGRPGRHQRRQGPGPVPGRRRPGPAHPGGPPAPGRPGHAPAGPWAWSSALMDVGAPHCRPRPRCGGCPVEAAGAGARGGGAAGPAAGPGAVRRLRPALARRHRPGAGRRTRGPGPGRPGRRRRGGRRRPARRLVRHPPGPPRVRGHGRHRRRRPPAPARVSLVAREGARDG